MKDSPFRTSSHVQPWNGNEFIFVNGFPLVYTKTMREGLIVRLPGGRSSTPEQLVRDGYTVRFPQKVRDDA